MADNLKKKHIVWYADLNKLDFKDSFIKRWWIGQVLIHGRMEDIKGLDFSEIKELLPNLELPSHLKALWEDYFKWREKIGRTK
ncbi:MAG: hypothetical protein COS84_07015 [Armatimonadetes bacterium CG07_land_8_20_14_0_80_40_9]|nr:MAG: hypothetical protein COS84_07015 [Armatimonadetes bacterium CG07_land_8_20_14_0_80_40_9]